eukprot:g2791.t1
MSAPAEEPARAGGERGEAGAEQEEEEAGWSAPEADEDDTGMPLALHSVVAGRKRKARGEEDDDSDGESSSSAAAAEASTAASSSSSTAADDIASGAAPEILEVDFEFNDTMEIDFHGIKQLLERSAWAVTNISEVADALIKQKGVGTCVKIDDTYNCVYGIISALNVAEARKNKLSSVGEMCNFLLSVCPNASKAAELTAAMTDEALQAAPLGLLVNERYVNMPPELTPVIHKQLVEDLKWSVEKLEPPEARAQWNLKRLLVVSRCFVDGSSHGHGAGGAVGNPSGLKKKKKKKRRKKTPAAATAKETAPLTYFLKYEDEIFLQDASMSFFFDASRVGASKSPAQDTAFGRESYFVALIDVDQLPSYVERMEKKLEDLQES